MVGAAHFQPVWAELSGGGGWRGGITIGLVSLGFCNMNFMRSGTDKMDREIHMSKE